MAQDYRNENQRYREWDASREHYRREIGNRQARPYQGYRNDNDLDYRNNAYDRNYSGSNRVYGHDGGPLYSRGRREGYDNRYHHGVGFNSPDYEREHHRSDYRTYEDRRRDSHDRGWLDKATDEFESWFGVRDAERRRHQDKLESHRGKGPRGYKRSDERIREDIADRLRDDDYIDASEVEIEVTDRSVVLSGTVSDRNEKYRAEDIAESVSGVTQVENRLRVRRNEYGTDAFTGGSQARVNTGGSSENAANG